MGSKGLDHHTFTKQISPRTCRKLMDANTQLIKVFRKHPTVIICTTTNNNIIGHLSSCYSEGVVEIWLTSEDLGAYGRDIGVTLPELLWQLVEVIPDGCMLRLGMTNPPYIMEHMKDMAAILSHPRVYSFLHVPVQCGSDAVLEDMKREYTIVDFRYLVDYLKEK